MLHRKLLPTDAYQWHAGPGTSVAPTISDFSVMEAIFAPFEEPALFHAWDPQALHSLLTQPLAARCPVPASQWPHYRLLAEDLFELESSTTAPQLLSALGAALHAPWPTGTPSELLYTPFWATVGLGLPEFASSILGFDVRINRYSCGRTLNSSSILLQHICRACLLNFVMCRCRNVEDPSITLPDKKRDYMVMIGNILLVGGEDKTHVGDLQVPSLVAVCMLACVGRWALQKRAIFEAADCTDRAVG